jgi:hypothetical protein
MSKEEPKKIEDLTNEELINFLNYFINQTLEAIENDKKVSATVSLVSLQNHLEYTKTRLKNES